jgi:AcrR family transcriptional regulator
MPPGDSSSPRAELLARAIDYYAQHGVLDTSMRTLAAGIGTSNRMLNYHFGSREDLLATVVEAVCEAEGDAIRGYLEASQDPFEAGLAYWQHVAATAEVFAPLFYELSAHAMYGKPYADRLRDVLVSAWLDAFTTGFRRVTDTPDEARQLAHLSLAVGRGVLFDLALGGDRATADATIAAYTAMVRQQVEPA